MLDRLQITGVRNLRPCSLSLSRLNLFYGDNGSGKTSLLEAVHLLATGKSFRSHQIRKVIQYGQGQCTVFSRLNFGQQLAILKNIEGSQILKRDGQIVPSVAQLTYDLPVQLIDTESMSLLDSGSKPRRQLLDWLVFHVEHNFLPTWQRYQRALLQRNALLKSDKVNELEWQVWEQELAESACILHQMRQRVFDGWLNFVQSACAILLPQYKLNISYIIGYDIEHNLQALLKQSREKDRQRGFTQIGAQRADVHIKTELGLAESVLSRGQCKLLVCALKLAQVAYLNSYQKQCVVLLDDLSSELDKQARSRLLSMLHQLGAQMLITAVEVEDVWPSLLVLDKKAKLFHVEQGEVLLQYG
ncbi:MAG: DNA replication/repair protein RecF [Pseudomonadales bacterium]|nr:DNA replication/repair protein RecF [Pseudomonadales bacterium]